MTIEDLIKDQIEQLDIKELVQIEIRKLVSDNARSEIIKTTKEEIQKIVSTEVKVQMAKSVKTDDGWGKKNEYESFEVMFKQLFAEAYNSKYEIQRIVKEHITTETKKLVEAKTKEITDLIRSQLNA